MTVAHHELVWNCLPDMRSDVQREADAGIDHVSRDEPDSLTRLRQDIIALVTEYDDRLAARNNVPLNGCPGCEARMLAQVDRVAEAEERTVRSMLRAKAAQREVQIRILAGQRQLVLAVA